MRPLLPGLFFLMGLMCTAHAQRVCGNTEYKQQILLADPSLKEVFKNIEQQIANVVNKSSGNIAMRDTSVNEIIHIPVVIHVLYKNAIENISDAQIRSQIDVLNNDFNLANSDRQNTPQAFKPLAGDARIQFCLAQIDPQGKKTNGIDRKYSTQDIFTTNDEMKLVAKGGTAAWDSKRYLNIWVCKLGSRSLGYATPPGGAADRDGVVIAYDAFGATGNLRASFNKGRTATHEVGHWLGLIHIWGDAACGDDEVNDTPSQQAYSIGCPAFPKMSNCSKDNNGDMFMNFMDFSDDACMNLFTRGQVKRMRALFAQNNIRNSFLASFACDSALAQVAPLPVNESLLKPSIVTTLASIKVYPSPVNAQTTIECNAATTLTSKSFNIFNCMGMKVFTARLIKQKTTLDLSKLVSGIYIIQIGDGQDKLTTRIIKL